MQPTALWAPMASSFTTTAPSPMNVRAEEAWTRAPMADEAGEPAPLAPQAPLSQATLQLTATREHLRHVFLVRSAVLLAALAYTGARWAADAPPMLGPWAGVFFALAMVLNTATWARLRRASPVSQDELLLHILADVALLGVALHLSGGDTSPLVDLYLVPLTLAAAALPLSRTALVFLAVIVAHEAVCVVLPAGNLLAIVEVSRNGDLVDLFAAALLAYIVYSMARSSREHYALLRSIHEDYLRQRHSADLGTLAAYAAHQLASPLASIAVLVNDLRRGLWRPKDLRQAFELMAKEIDTCKAVTARLLASAGYSRAESGGRVSADRFLAAIVDKCQLMYPWLSISCRHDGEAPAPEILAEASLEQAILALLKCRPGPTRKVDVHQRWDGEHLHIHICHCESKAQDPQTSELDILMASHTMSRFGGAVERMEHMGHGEGPCVKLSLPLNNLSVGAHASAAA